LRELKFFYTNNVLMLASEYWQIRTKLYDYK
jgi:hypothetical protein